MGAKSLPVVLTQVPMALSKCTPPMDATAAKPPSHEKSVAGDAASPLSSRAPRTAAAAGGTAPQGGKPKPSASSSPSPGLARLFAKPIIPGVEHLPGEGVGGMLFGKAWSALDSDTNYKFVRNVINPAGDAKPRTFYAGGQKYLVLSDGRDINAVSAAVPEMTQDESFGKLGELFGSRNILKVDTINEADPRKRERYAHAIRVFTATTGDTRAMAKFYFRATDTIEQHLAEAAQSPGGESLEKLIAKIAMDLGCMLMMSGGKLLPSQLAKLKPHELPPELAQSGMSVLELFNNLTSRLSFKGDGVVNNLLRGLHLKNDIDLPKEERCLIAYGKFMLRENYDEAYRNERSSLQMTWKRKDYFGGPLKEGEPPVPLPASWAEFEAMEKSGLHADKFRDLYMDQAFMQLVTFETTKEAMNFSFREMKNRPETFAAVKAEVAALRQKHGTGPEHIQPEQMSAELPQLSRFVMETLRLYTPAPLIHWTTKDKLVIPIDGENRVIEKGTAILFDNEIANQKAWERAGSKFPGNEFHPERYDYPGFDFSRALHGLAKGSDDMRSFGGGPGLHGNRVCPGRLPAAMEVAKLLMALTDYDIETSVSPVPLDRSGRETLRPDEDITLRLKRAAE